MSNISTIEQALSMSFAEIEADGSYPIERELASGETFKIGSSTDRVDCSVGDRVEHDDWGFGVVIKAWQLTHQPWFLGTGYTVLVVFDSGEIDFTSSSGLSPLNR